MNTTAAYVVLHQQETLPATLTLFAHAKLLTARKAAMSYVECLLAELWQRGDMATTIEVHLVSSPSGPITVHSPAVALVYQLDIPVARPAYTYPEAKAILLRALEQLQEEFMYYQANGHSMGFGCFSTQFEDTLPAGLPYFHLYDATGYVNEFVGRCNGCRIDSEGAELLTYSAHDDRHYCAGTLVDEFIQ